MPKFRTLFLAVAVLAANVAHGAFSRLVFFGDSLTDVGNTASVTLGIQPGSAYWQGRFSNGPVWSEQLGTRLGLPVVRSRSNGYNYAYGGAETGSGYEFLVIPNLITQVNQYLAARTPAQTELFVVWAGGNDYLNGQTDFNVPVANLESQIVRLYNAGARHFLVPNLPWLGFVPRNVGTAQEAPMNMISMQHNDLLHQRLWALRRSKPSIKIYQLNIAGHMGLIRTSPATFGLVNVTQPAYNGSTVVPNPNEYAFWDEIHPTTVVHAILAEQAHFAIRSAIRVR